MNALLDRARAAESRSDDKTAHTLYTQALQAAPNDPSTLLSFGHFLFARHHYRDAAAQFGRALANGQVPVTTLKALAIALTRAGLHADALRPYDAYRGYAPTDTEITADYLATLYALNRHEDVLAFVASLPLDHPQGRLATVYAAESEMAKGDIDAAISRLESALERWPDHIELLPAMGKAYGLARRFDDALRILTRARDLAPDQAMHWNNLGNALKNAERNDAALAAFARARALDPALAATTFINETGVYKHLHRLDDGINAAREALKREPHNPHAHYALGTLLLMARDYHAAWPHIEHRFERRDPAMQPPPFPAKLWRGDDLAGKRLAVYADQGVGDSIQMLRYLPLLDRFHPKRVAVYAQNKLRGLIENNMPGIGFMATDAQGFHWDESAFDALIPICSLPAIFDTGIDTIPPQTPLRAMNRRNYGDGVTIGLAWRTKSLDAGYKRSLALHDFKGLKDIPGLRFISLQYGDIAAECDEAAKDGLRIDEDPSVDQWSDLQSFVDQIHGCTLVISIDNSTVHAAGACGVPTWTILPYDPYWRWHLDTPASPWYPGMRLYRALAPGDFSAPLDAITKDLKRLAKSDFSVLEPSPFIPGSI
ncbi:MAG: tetratricopeptide repeat protein [Rhodospirillales bacterium]|nr:tetratricopeptide repeat protein [Rhodospirillales bacterium]USO08119.1 MAG: tetratricopeptide repeat protein [Rhodospirillales bacterium]